MDSGPLVVDISPDEDDYDWISELLEEVERRRRDGSDDGVSLNPKRRPTAAEGSDDDTVVLDGDPEKVDVVEGNANAAGESDDLIVVGEKGQIACRDYPHSRHLCANFPFASSPHDRHCHQCYCYVCDSLAPCVHWGNGTSSIDHCHANDKDEFWISQRQYSKRGDKAPLPVHKLPDTTLPSLPQQNQCPTLTWLPPDSAALNRIFRPTAISACMTLTSSWLPPDSAALNRIFRPTAISACMTSTSFGIPNIASQGRSQQYEHVLSSNKFQPHLVSKHLLRAQNDFIQGDPRHDSGNLGLHIINSQKVFKRAGSRVALATNRSRYGSFYKDLLTEYCRNASAAAASNDKNPSRWQGFPNRMTSNQNAYHPPSHQNMSSIFVNSVPSQTQVYSQPIPAVNEMRVGFQQVKDNFSAQDQQSSEVDTSLITPNRNAYNPPSHQNMSNVFLNSVPSQTQVYSQPIPAVNEMQVGFQQVKDNFTARDQQSSEVDTSLITPKRNAYNPPSHQNMSNVFLNSVPSQTQVYSQPIPAVNEMQVGFQQVKDNFSAWDQQSSEVDTSLITPNRNAYNPPCHQNMSNVFLNSMPSQTQVYSQPIPAVNYMQVGFQQVNEDFSALDQQFSEVDTSSIPCTGQSNKQYLPDNSQALSAKLDPQIPVKTNPGSLDFLVDCWIQGYQPALGAL